MTQLFFKEFVSQLWRLNSITKLEEIISVSPATSTEKMDAGKPPTRFLADFGL